MVKPEEEENEDFDPFADDKEDDFDPFAGDDKPEPKP